MTSAETEGVVQQLQKAAALVLEAFKSSDGGYHHLIICNYQNVGGTFCNCGLKQLETALAAIVAAPSRQEQVQPCEACGHGIESHNLQGLKECYAPRGEGICQCEGYEAVGGSSSPSEEQAMKPGWLKRQIDAVGPCPTCGTVGDKRTYSAPSSEGLVALVEKWREALSVGDEADTALNPQHHAAYRGVWRKGFNAGRLSCADELSEALASRESKR